MDGIWLRLEKGVHLVLVTEAGLRENGVGIGVGLGFVLGGDLNQFGMSVHDGPNRIQIPILGPLTAENRKQG